MVADRNCRLPAGATAGQDDFAVAVSGSRCRVQFCTVTSPTWLRSSSGAVGAWRHPIH